MRGVALISGGKDSVLSAHLAQAWNVEVAYAIHLCPKNQDETRDSYMYQSAGSQVAQAIVRECLPLRDCVVAEVQHEPRQINNNYFSLTEDDEVYDLYNALRSVVVRDATVRVVVSGAIMSRYQTIRLEHCCHLLKLASLAPLYGLDQRLLLEFFCSHREFDVCIVKTAATGLDASFVTQRLADAAPRLLRLNERIGLQLCGEGGEYETLVLDAPLYRKEIELTCSVQSEREVHMARIEHMKLVVKPFAAPVKFRIPLMHTGLKKISDVSGAARASFQRMDLSALPRAERYSVGKESCVVLNFYSQSSLVQMPQSWALVSCEARSATASCYSLATLGSAERGLAGLVHCLVQLRNFVSAQFVDEVYARLFGAAAELEIGCPADGPSSEEVAAVVREFQAANAAWRHHGAMCLAASRADGFLGVASAAEPAATRGPTQTTAAWAVETTQARGVVGAEWTLRVRDAAGAFAVERPVAAVRANVHSFSFPLFRCS